MPRGAEVHITIGEIAKSVFVYLGPLVDVPVLIGLVNMALALGDRFFPGETGEVARVANCAVAVDGPAGKLNGRARA